MPDEQVILKVELDESNGDGPDRGTSSGTAAAAAGAAGGIAAARAARTQSQSLSAAFQDALQVDRERRQSVTGPLEDLRDRARRIREESEQRRESARLRQTEMRSRRSSLVTLAKVAAVASAAATGLELLRRSANSLVQELGELSQPIAFQRALAQTELTLGRFRAAQRVGPQLGEFIRAQTQVELGFLELKTELVRTFAPLLTSMNTTLGQILRGAGRSIEFTNDVIENVGGINNVLLRILAAIPPGNLALDQLAQEKARIDKLAEEQQSEFSERLERFFDGNNFRPPEFVRPAPRVGGLF